MNLIREVHHARLFRLFLADMAGRLTVERLADQLSALADATLEVVMEEVWKTVPGRHIERPKFAIVPTVNSAARNWPMQATWIWFSCLMIMRRTQKRSTCVSRVD